MKDLCIVVLILITFIVESVLIICTLGIVLILAGEAFGFTKRLINKL